MTAYVSIAEGFDSYSTGSSGALSELLRRGFLEKNTYSGGYDQYAYLPDFEVLTSGYTGKCLSVKNKITSDYPDLSSTSLIMTNGLSLGRDQRMNFGGVSFRFKPVMFSPMAFYIVPYDNVSYSKYPDTTSTPIILNVCPIFGNYNVDVIDGTSILFAVESGGFISAYGARPVINDGTGNPVPASSRYDFLVKPDFIVGNSILPGLNEITFQSGNWHSFQSGSVDQFYTVADYDMIDSKLLVNIASPAANSNIDFLCMTSSLKMANPNLNPGDIVFECHYDDFVFGSDTSGYWRTPVCRVENVALASTQYTANPGTTLVLNGTANGLDTFDDDVSSIGMTGVSPAFELNLDSIRLSQLLAQYGQRSLLGIAFNHRTLIKNYNGNKDIKFLINAEDDPQYVAGIVNGSDSSYDGRFYTVNYKTDSLARFSLSELTLADVVVGIRDTTP